MNNKNKEIDFNSFYLQKISDFLGLVTDDDYRAAKNQLWREYKELFWYNCAQGYMPDLGINRIGIPSGKHCNPSFDKWCPWLNEKCMRYGKMLLMTDNRMSSEFSRQYRCDRCKDEFPKGNTTNSEQLSINDM